MGFNTAILPAHTNTLQVLFCKTELRLNEHWPKHLKSSQDNGYRLNGGGREGERKRELVLSVTEHKTHFFWKRQLRHDQGIFPAFQVSLPFLPAPT